MGRIIAIANQKGGVGKTTLCGLMIDYLSRKGKTPILAVDADANANLNEVLGVDVEMTLGEIREEVTRAEMSKENPIPKGMTKADYMEVYHLDSENNVRESITDRLIEEVQTDIKDAAANIRRNHLPRKCDKENCSKCHFNYLCLSKPEKKAFEIG